MKKYLLIITVLLCAFTLVLPHALAVEPKQDTAVEFKEDTYDSIKKKKLKEIYTIVTKGEYNGITIGSAKEDIINTWGQPHIETDQGYLCYGKWYWGGLLSREYAILKIEDNKVKWIDVIYTLSQSRTSTVAEFLGKTEGHFDTYNDETTKPVTINDSLFTKGISSICIGSMTKEEEVYIFTTMEPEIMQLDCEQKIKLTTPKTFTPFALRVDRYMFKYLKPLLRRYNQFLVSLES